jgi:hypothetical protein
VAMATAAPETFWGLLAVDSDATERLAAVSLCEAGPSFICFDPYNDVSEVLANSHLFICQIRTTKKTPSLFVACNAA